MSDMQANDRSIPHTLMIRCPVCGSDAGETLGVTGAMDPALQSTVVMACERCETVYLSPAPERDHDHNRGAEAVHLAPVRKWMRDIPARTRVFCADADPRSVSESDPAAGRFEQILLPLTLESAVDPGAILGHAASLLETDGRADVLVGNIDSTAFRIFGGRHWFGYRFPEVRQCFGAEGIRLLAAGQGMRVTGTRTLFTPAAWLASARNWLRDWGAGRLLTNLATGPWGVPWLLAAVAEGIARLRGRGAVLVVHLSKEAA